MGLTIYYNLISSESRPESVCWKNASITINGFAIAAGTTDVVLQLRLIAGVIRNAECLIPLLSDIDSKLFQM